MTVPVMSLVPMMFPVVLVVLVSSISGSRLRAQRRCAK